MRNPLRLIRKPRESRFRASNRRINSAAKLERLEQRTLLTNVLSYHNDSANTGQNLAETVLTPSNVNSTQFGKDFSVSLDGYTYAQPLYVEGVTTTAGSDPGLHNVVFVATEHDSVYAIDADNGTVLWQNSFLLSGLPGATTIIPVPSSDVGVNDIRPEIGITGTPVIDTDTNTLYAVARTKETVNGVAHYVQRLHALDITSGAEKVGSPVLIGDTTGGNNNNTQVYVYGNGAGSVTDPYNGTGDPVDQFNALRENLRSGLTLTNGAVYIAFASLGDIAPYHGWILSYNATTLELQGVFNATPNGSDGGIWQSGGPLDVDSDGNIFCMTGNGTFDGQNGATGDTPPAPGPVTGLDSNGFPVNGDYGDSFLKLSLDPNSTPTDQNINGWGLMVVDYFTPFNQQPLSNRDADLGSGGPLLLPDSAGSMAHPHLIIGAGKEGRVYLIDRDNMGKFGLTDNVVQETDANVKSWSSPAYFNGSLYYGGKNMPLEAFSVSDASFSTSPTSQSSNVFIAFVGTTPSVSANGSSVGIVWALDNSAYNTSGPAILYAYDATNLANQLYNSTQAADNRDQAAGAVKFTVPTVVDGKVYVGGEYALTVYGLLSSSAPAAPSDLSATAVSASQIDLAWTDNASNETSYQVQRSLDGVSFSTIATLPANSSSYSDTGLAAATQYYYQVVGSNPVGDSAPSNIASATTPEGLVAEWTFEEGTGTTAGDASGNNHTGTLVGDVTWTGGEVGSSAVSFDPTSGTNPHVVVADAPDLRFNSTQSFSLGAWVYVPSLPGKWSAIVAKSRARSPWYGLWISNTNHWVAGGPTNLVGSLVTTGWHYVTLVQDGTANQRLLYVDGVQVAAGTAQNANGTGDLWIGGAQSVNEYLDGSVDEVRLYQRALSASEVQTLASLYDPAAPTNLSATAVSASQIDLAWTDNASNETSYQVQRSLDGVSFSTIATLPANSSSYSDTGLAAATQYYYQVVASNSAGDSAPSNIANATTFQGDIAARGASIPFATTVNDAQATPYSLYSVGVDSLVSVQSVVSLVGWVNATDSTGGTHLRVESPTGNQTRGVTVVVGSHFDAARSSRVGNVPAQTDTGPRGPLSFLANSHRKKLRVRIFPPPNSTTQEEGR